MSTVTPIAHAPELIAIHILKLIANHILIRTIVCCGFVANAAQNDGAVFGRAHHGNEAFSDIQHDVLPVRQAAEREREGGRKGEMRGEGGRENDNSNEETYPQLMSIHKGQKGIAEGVQILQIRVVVVGSKNQRDEAAPQDGVQSPQGQVFLHSLFLDHQL